ncbi:saccharopine dehydrogenase family protein [Paracoccus aerodenitrificans]|uniref:saccharopine dehydrogenase family protein n=1 Tax=Paracoccus aerodenitrificans TaxID=3017781 RepID=UPI0022F0C167|nr:saccharopine dehydrogenase NADP-binding domain-containing protein [Paracoccus aerodenitrificans]WBU62974.1 saccharopine dehydrogenase NADP-binding domain-containing protein [Paracoccus aerodenitrificans]
MTDLMVYGAYGYSGELVVRELVRRGRKPVIAGRSADKLIPLAQELSLPHRAFDVTDATEALQGIKTLLNCAGPFAKTAAPLVDTCLAQSIHYIDITGEIPVFTYCHQRAEQARKAGVILCPGAGFDVVPTDCLAAELKSRIPNAETINLAFSFGTKPSIGTATTALEAIQQGGRIRRDHELKPVGNAYRLRRIPFPSDTLWTATLPWGDVYTSGISTGVPNGMVYAALPLPAGILTKLTSPIRSLFGKPFVKSRLEKLIRKNFSGGPDDQARAEERTEFWGEAIAPGGKRLEMHFSAPNVYSLTVDAAVGITCWCHDHEGDTAGYFTASMLMGKEFISTLTDVSPMTEVTQAG